jgi:hypothetical protein
VQVFRARVPKRAITEGSYEERCGRGVVVVVGTEEGVGGERE